jgi:hypothetical protein
MASGSNTVPGVIDTPIWTKLPASAGSNAPIDPNEVAKAPVLLGTAGQVQTSREWVLFLASDASSYMTGAELVIDGGGMTGARPSLELILTALAATRAGLTFSRCRRDTVGYRR